MSATMLSLTTVAALVALLPRASAFGPTSFPLTAPQKISSARCVSLRAPQPAALRAPRQARTGEAQRRCDARPAHVYVLHTHIYPLAPH